MNLDKLNDQELASMLNYFLFCAENDSYSDIEQTMFDDIKFEIELKKVIAINSLDKFTLIRLKSIRNLINNENKEAFDIMLAILE